jgi:hypothetical protein
MFSEFATDFFPFLAMLAAGFVAMTLAFQYNWLAKWMAYAIPARPPLSLSIKLLRSGSMIDPVFTTSAIPPEALPGG